VTADRIRWRKKRLPTVRPGHSRERAVGHTSNRLARAAHREDPGVGGWAFVYSARPTRDVAIRLGAGDNPDTLDLRIAAAAESLSITTICPSPAGEPMHVASRTGALPTWLCQFRLLVGSRSCDRDRLVSGDSRALERSIWVRNHAPPANRHAHTGATRGERVRLARGQGHRCRRMFAQSRPRRRPSAARTVSTSCNVMFAQNP